MAFVGRRLLHSIFVLWAVATILFLMFRLMPGNPLAAYISEALSAEQQNLIMQQFGLDRPLWEQYVIYFGNLVLGELGTSFHRREPVLSIVLSVLPNTIILTFCGLFIAYAFGILAGAYLAWHRGTWIEGVVVPVALATRAAPEFWLGMILLAVFAFWLGWFPSGGANSAGAMYAGELDRIFSRDFLLHLTLPALTIAPNISANVVVETVFSWPGLGRLLVQAVSTSDYPLAQGAFFLIALVVIVMNFVADLLYGFLDPRVSHGR